MKLRYYQDLMYAEICRQWELGLSFVLAMAPTGAGKTPILGHAIKHHVGAACAIAHRDNLVMQLSMSLARLGVRHRVIASTKTQRAIAAEHAAELGAVYLDPGSRVGVASAQTLAKRDDLAQWCAQVTLVVVDEGHHACKQTTWGKCIDRFTHPRCRGLLPTATPGRADGKGLGRHHDGYADVMVALVDDGDKLGVRVALPGESITCAPAKILIREGFLTPYRVACVDSHIAEFLGDVAASGDWSQAQLKSAVQHSSVVGDVVQSYKQFADGKIGITFTTDVETAGQIASAYRAAGISAEVLTGETDHSVRRSIFKRLSARKLQQVVAVDVISEGTDIPAIEVVTFARPTASLGLFLQQLGRALRLMDGKEYALLIDHVGNFLRHRGGPDTPRTWTLDRRDKRAPKVDDAIPMRVCLEPTCASPYERHLDCCPYCGTPVPEPAERGAPDQVDGVLSLMDEETLARLRGETPETVDALRDRLAATGLNPIYVAANAKRHRERLAVLGELRTAMESWGGIYHERGESDTEIQRRFWLQYGVDVASAGNLSREDADKLLTRVSAAVRVGG